MVTHLSKGDKVPGKDLAERIAECGDPWPTLADWSQALPAQAPRVAREPSAAPLEVTAEDTATEAGKLLALIRDLQTDVAEAGEEDGGLQAKVRMAAQLAEAVDKLGRHTGIKLTTRQILASPLWREVEDAIDRALADHPDIARKVASELEALCA